MTVSPLPTHGRWARDLRDENRGVRVSAHVERGLLLLSVWRAGSCVGTVQLLPTEAAELMAGLSDGLAHLAQALSATAVGTDKQNALARRLQDVERRLTDLETRSAG